MNHVAMLLTATALVAVSSAVGAEEKRTDTAPENEQDIVVLGKGYGREVGKTVTPLKDVPNTLSIVDSARIEAQNLFTLEDALTATPGITVTGVSSEDPSYLSRGFTINNYLIDGVPTLSFAFPGVVPDLFAYDRLEVLRGPAGLFSGSGNPAGSINLVRKRPLEEFKMQATAGYGSYNNLRLSLDVSTPIGDRVGVRAGVMAQDQDQFFDVAHRNRWGGFAVAQAKIGERTTLTFGGNYDHFMPAIQSGLPGYAGGADGSEGRLLDVDRSTYLGADWNRFKSESWSSFVELAHQVSDRWTLRATGLIANVDRVDIYSYIGAQAVTAANRGVTNHIAYRGDSFQRTRSFDFNGIGTFPLLGRDQTLILGADYQAQDYDSYYTRLSNYGRIDVFNPVSTVEPPLNPYGPSAPYAGANGLVNQVYGGTTTQVEQFGLYGQLRFSPVAGLTLTGGGRLTWWESDNQVVLPTVQPPTDYSFENRFTPYAGVVWDVTRDLNLYFSYADSFTPVAAPAGRSLPGGGDPEPLIGEQFEAGSKLSLMNDRLLVSGAVYQITQTNRVFSDPNIPTLYLQIGKVRARGVEAEVSGELLPDWRINAGYSYTHSEYLEDANPTFEGISLLPVIPEHMFKMFTNYAPQGGVLSGLSVGGGVTWYSETWGGNPTVYNANGTVRTISSVVRQGSYAVFDVRAGYQLTPNWNLSVNVNNALDREYYARISSTARGNFYGSPRTVFATLKYTFE